MRTFEEIHADIGQARSINDAAALRSLAGEMQEIGTPEAEASACNAIGNAARLTGDYPAALEHYHRALAVAEKLGDRSGVARITNNISTVYRDSGEYPVALEHFRRALALYEDLDDRAGVAMTTTGVGGVFQYIGDYPAALEHAQRALALYEELGDRAGVAYCTANIGIVYARTGNRSEALEHYRRALALHEELGNHASVARVTGNIGNVYAETGDLNSALEHYQRALAVHDKLGNRSGVANVTGNMIGVLIQLGRYDDATDLLERQASILMDDPRVRSSHQAHRAELSENRGDLDAAHRYLLEALSIASEAGLRAEVAELCLHLRDLAQRRSDFAGYIEHNNEYIRISEEIRGQEATQRLTMLEADRRLEAERRERERVRALLFGALPRSVADRMIRGEAVNGDHFPDAAVLFADVAGFTSGSSSLDASQLVTLLEGVFETFDRICDEQAMIKVKTIGDSYMCFKGDATPEENAAALARAALAVRSTGFTWPDGSPLRFRIGLHCGPVTAGVIGTQRLQYDVWGDTVNVASRMESSGEGGRIHVSETFAQLLAGADTATIQHSLIPRGEVEVKGKGTMRTYWLEGA